MSVSSSLSVANLTKDTNNVHAIEFSVLCLSGHRCSERLQQVRCGMCYGLSGKSIHHAGLLTHASEMTQICLDSGVCGLRYFGYPRTELPDGTLSSGFELDQYVKTLGQLSFPTLLDFQSANNSSLRCALGEGYWQECCAGFTAGLSCCIRNSPEDGKYFLEKP